MATNSSSKDSPKYDKPEDKYAFENWLKKCNVVPVNHRCCYICLEYFPRQQVSECDGCGKPFCKNCLPLRFVKECKFPPFLYSWCYFCLDTCCSRSLNKHACNGECRIYKMRQYIEPEESLV